MTQFEHFRLDGIERSSELWLKIDRFLTRELDRARIKNDDPRLSDGQTAALRGEIAALKALQRLGRAPMSPPTSADMTLAAGDAAPEAGAPNG